MKKYLFTVILFAFASYDLPLTLRAGVESELADKYFSRFQGADGTTAKFVWGELYKEVPPSERDELFASILDRGAKDPDNPRAIELVLSSLGSKAPAWSPHLEGSVLAPMP